MTGKYSDDEVRAIIDRALSSGPDRDVSHEDLLAIASEVGISREAIERAAREVEDGREGIEASQRILRRRRRRLASHLWAFMVVNLFLFAVNFLTTPGEWWVLFSLLGWGLALLFHARAALSKEVSDRALRRERKRMRAERPAPEQQRAAERPRISTGTLDRAAAELGSAVQERVGQMLSKAAAELRAGTPAARTRVTDAPPTGGARVRADQLRVDAELDEPLTNETRGPAAQRRT